MLLSSSVKMTVELCTGEQKLLYMYLTHCKFSQRYAQGAAPTAGLPLVWSISTTLGIPKIPPVQSMDYRRWASIDCCDSHDVPWKLARLPPPRLSHFFTNQYVPCVTSQQGSLFYKVRHWGVAAFTGFQLFILIHFVCDVIERLATIQTMVYMYTNPCNILVGSNGSADSSLHTIAYTRAVFTA